MIITPGSIPVYISPPIIPLNQSAAQVRSFDAYYTQNPSNPYGPGVCVNAFPLSGSSISRYCVYRSVVGFMGNVVAPSVVDGKTLQISVNLGLTQTLTFDASTPVVDRINSLLSGGRACAATLDPTRFIWRVDGGSSPGVVQILGGTALADLGLVAGTYSAQSHANRVTFVEPQSFDDVYGVEWCDPDGGIYDSYRLATVDLSNEESRPTAWVAPLQTTGKVCWVYGVVSDVAGVRIPDAVVSARILELPQSVVSNAFIDRSPVSALSNPQGRFEICLLQSSLVELSIASIFYTRQVRVPAQSRVSLSDLQIDRDYRYELGVEI